MKSDLKIRLLPLLNYSYSSKNSTGTFKPEGREVGRYFRKEYAYRDLHLFLLSGEIRRFCKVLRMVQ